MDETATETIAREFARELKPGDCYYLRGDVGSGKSFFSRSFVRAAYEDDALPVTSPTFTLVNVYDDLEDEPAIHHYDLYRIDSIDQLSRLRLDLNLPRVVSLIEWPEAVDSREAPQERLELWFETVTPEELKEVMAGREGNEDENEDAKDKVEEGAEYEDRAPRRLKIHIVGSRWNERLSAVMSRVAAMDIADSGSKQMGSS